MPGSCNKKLAVIRYTSMPVTDSRKDKEKIFV